MPQHTRRPPAPPAPEFYIADPQPPRPPEAPAQPTPPPAPDAAAPPEKARPAAPRARHEDAPSAVWHRSERWAVAMLVALAIMLVAIYVPGTAKLVLIALSAVAGLTGVVLLIRRGLFDDQEH